MAYDLATVTNSGNQLLASVVPDKSSLVIDKIEVSGTKLASSTDLKSMTSISNVVQTLSANGYQKKDNSFIISTVLDNSSVDADYQAWVFGIWAHKADGGSSVLMSVITSTDSPDTISKGAGTPIDYNYKFITTFSNTKSLKIKMSSDTYATNDTVLHNSGDETATGTKTFQEIKISNKKFPSLVQTDGQYVTLDGGNTEIVPADNSKVVHTTGDETIDGKKKFNIDPTDGAGNAYAKTVDVNQQLDKKVNVADMRKPASDVAGIEEVNAKQDKIGYTPADDSKVVHTTDTSNWQKHKLTADNGSAKLVIASGEDVNEKLKAIVGTKDTGKLLVDISAKNNPTGHSLVGEYFCDFDGLVTGYGIGQDGAMWGFTYNGATTLWKLILIAKKPGIPSLAVKYNAGKKAFDYTLTAPEKDGLSDITQYNLLWKDHGVDDWTTVIVKPDSLTGQLTGVGIKKTYDFKASAQNAVGESGFTDVITLGTAVVPGIPKLAVKYNAGKKGFDYTVTAPESDGGSEITGYSLEYQKQGGRDWTKIALKPNSLAGTVTDGIEAGSNYLFRVNAENAAGSSDYFTISHPVLTVDDNIYGASWDGSAPGILQRTDAAVGLKAGINGAQNDFDTRGPWGLMDKNVTDSYGNAFVRVPKFYIRKTQDKSKPLSTWQVSLVKQGADWYLPNCFYDFDNKKELAYVDVSRYEGSVSSDKLQSISGATPTTNQSITSLRSLAVANNTDGKKGYHLWDVHTLDALQVLFTIEFATLDSQSIMEGNDTGSSAISNGTTDNVKGSSGFAASGAAPMTYRGIENLYGNLAIWTDGLNITNLSLYSCDDATKYVSDTFTDPYYMLNYSLLAYNSGNTNITSLGFDKDHPSIEAPTSYNSDNYNTYYHDYGYVNGSGNYVVCTGGSWHWGAGFSGLWCWYGYCSSADASSNIGSRLLKKAL